MNCTRLKNSGGTPRELNKIINEQIIREVKKALEALKGSGVLKLESFPEVYLERPKYDTHGDLSCNIALRLAKPERKKPLDIAETIAGAIKENIGDDVPFSKVAVAKPGFINFYLDDNIALFSFGE